MPIPDYETLDGDRREYGKRIVSELATKFSWMSFC
jgi:hypothetical protein